MPVIVKNCIYLIKDVIKYTISWNMFADVRKVRTFAMCFS